MLRKKEKIVVITCDSCGRTMYGEPKIVSIDTGKKKRLELCPSCLRRLEIAMDWKKYGDKKVSLNFNSFIETTLGKDGADAYNETYSKFDCEKKKPGDIWETQLHNYCQIMIPAFEKMCGAYQGVAYPFTIRFELNELSFEKEIND